MEPTARPPSRRADLNLGNMRANSGQRSAQDFVNASATPADEVLTYTDSDQICTFAVLDTYDFVLHNKHHIHKGLDITTPSLKIDCPLQLTTVETIGLVFRGEAPQILMVVEREDLPKAIQTGDRLVKKLTTLQNLTLVVLDTQPRKLIDLDGLQLMAKIPWNLSHTRLTDRRVTSIKQTKDWIA